MTAVDVPAWSSTWMQWRTMWRLGNRALDPSTLRQRVERVLAVVALMLLASVPAYFATRHSSRQPELAIGVQVTAITVVLHVSVVFAFALGIVLGPRLLFDDTLQRQWRRAPVSSIFRAMWLLRRLSPAVALVLLPVWLPIAGALTLSASPIGTARVTAGILGLGGLPALFGIAMGVILLGMAAQTGLRVASRAARALRLASLVALVVAISLLARRLALWATTMFGAGSPLAILDAFVPSPLSWSPLTWWIESLIWRTAVTPTQTTVALSDAVVALRPSVWLTMSTLWLVAMAAIGLGIIAIGLVERRAALHVDPTAESSSRGATTVARRSVAEWTVTVDRRRIGAQRGRLAGVAAEFLLACAVVVVAWGLPTGSENILIMESRRLVALLAPAMAALTLTSLTLQLVVPLLPADREWRWYWRLAPIPWDLALTARVRPWQGIGALVGGLVVLGTLWPLLPQHRDIALGIGMAGSFFGVGVMTWGWECGLRGLATDVAPARVATGAAGTRFVLGALASLMILMAVTAPLVAATVAPSRTGFRPKIWRVLQHVPVEVALVVATGVGMATLLWAWRWPRVSARRWAEATGRPVPL